MRRVNLKYGLKQRINEIIGTDYSSEWDVPGLTPWSIQAHMRENIRRLARGIAGGASGGRIASGLDLSGVDTPTLRVNSGIGICPSGDLVVLGISLSRTVSNGTYYVYLLHRMRVAEKSGGGDLFYGKTTSFIGPTASSQIVYDDAIATLSQEGSNETEIKNNYLQLLSSQSDPEDSVYLGEVMVTGGKITEINVNQARCFDPVPSIGSNPSGMIIEKLVVDTLDVETLNIAGDISVSGDLTLNQDLHAMVGISTIQDLVVNDSIKAQGSSGFTGSVEIIEDGGGTKTLNFKSGIFINAT